MSEDSSTHSGSPSDSASPTLDDVSQTSSRQSTSEQNSSRKVYFPEEETDLVTGYLEPPNPWQYAQYVTREELISRYKSSCLRHGSEPLARVLEQLKAVDVEEELGEMKVDNVSTARGGRSEVLDLRGERLGHHHCEPLEEILKRLQFDTINLEDSLLDDEASVAIFDMVEYYEAAKQLNISSNNSIGQRGWQACSQLLKKTRCLEKLIARNTMLNEQLMPALCRGLRIGTNLQILHLENCNLSGRSVLILVSALKTNSALKELHLADNGLKVADALHIGDLLRVNTTLQLLDVSNNYLHDKGVGHICDGLVDQSIHQGHYVNLMKDLSGISGVGHAATPTGTGLTILVLWNNQLTKNSAFSFYKLLANSKTLDTLNIGRNTLTGESLLEMKEALQQSRSLERLGLQSTCISCEGAIALAECIAVNSRLQRIDLRDNPIQIGGLMALARSMKVCTGVTRLDLDDNPKKKLAGGEESLKQYHDLVQEIREYGARNAREAEERRTRRRERGSEEDSGGGELAEENSSGEAGALEEQRVSKSPIHCTTSISANSRKISLTCETMLRSNAVVPGDGSDQRKGGSCLSPVEPRRGLGVGRLRSPAPSPVPSPSPSPTPSPHSSPIPSPSRSRFHVSKVPDNTFFLSTPPQPHLSSLHSPDPSPSSLPSRFKVTLVSEPSTSSPASTTLTCQRESVPIQSPPTVVTSSTSNVTIGFKFDEEKAGEKASGAAAESSSEEQANPHGGDESVVEEGWNFDEPSEKEKVSVEEVAGSEKLLPGTEESETSIAGEVTSEVPPPPAIAKPSPYSVTGRIRKFSNIIPPHNLGTESNPPRNPSSLERLLGLFQHPSSIFSKSLANPLCTQNGANQSSMGVGYLFGSPSVPNIVRLPSTEIQSLKNAPSTTKSSSFSSAFISNVMQEGLASAGEYRSSFPGTSHDSKSTSLLPNKPQCPSSKLPGEVHASLQCAFQDEEQGWSTPEFHKGVDDGQSGCNLDEGVMVVSTSAGRGASGSRHCPGGAGIGENDATRASEGEVIEGSPQLTALGDTSLDSGVKSMVVPAIPPTFSSSQVVGSELIGTCHHFPDPNCNTYNNEEVDNMEAVKRNNEKGGGLWAVGVESMQLDIVATCLKEGSSSQEGCLVASENVVGDAGSASQTANVLAHIERQQE